MGSVWKGRKGGSRVESESVFGGRRGEGVGKGGWLETWERGEDFPRKEGSEQSVERESEEVC